jgi:hypothetical protein
MENLGRDIYNLFLNETDADVHFRVVTELSGTDCDTTVSHLAVFFIYICSIKYAKICKQWYW